MTTILASSKTSADDPPAPPGAATGPAVSQQPASQPAYAELTDNIRAICDRDIDSHHFSIFGVKLNDNVDSLDLQRLGIDPAEHLLYANGMLVATKVPLAGRFDPKTRIINRVELINNGHGTDSPLFVQLHLQNANDVQVGMGKAEVEKHYPDDAVAWTTDHLEYPSRGIDVVISRRSNRPNSPPDNDTVWTYRLSHITIR